MEDTQWPLILALGRQRQTDLYEFKATLGYMGLEKSLKEKQSQAVVAHIFNPSTREVETGSDMAGQREKYKAGGDRSLGFSLRILRDGIQSKNL